MISYEGLFLATGRADEGRDLLRAYARTLSEGMLANTADTGRTEYNTADATLWFLHAVDRHVAATGDTDLAAELVDPLDDRCPRAPRRDAVRHRDRPGRRTVDAGRGRATRSPGWMPWSRAGR